MVVDSVSRVLAPLHTANMTLDIGMFQLDMQPTWILLVQEPIGPSGEPNVSEPNTRNQECPWANQIVETY